MPGSSAARPPVPRTFMFQTAEVRCCGTDRDLWFVAKDVCEALGISWRGNTLDNIKADWKGMRKLRMPQRNPDGTIRFQLQDVVVITEAALYKLAFRSNKAEADTFTDWIAGEVLPAIRKTGAYQSKRRQKYQAIGKPEEWIEQREEGIEERKAFTDVLQSHDCTNYAGATNEIYRPVLGGSAAQVKMTLQLKPKANLRDSLSTHDLAKVKFAEMLASDKIEGDNLRGERPCLAAARLAGNAVAQARDMVRMTKIV